MDDVHRTFGVSNYEGLARGLLAFEEVSEVSPDSHFLALEFVARRAYLFASRLILGAGIGGCHGADT
jgi:hypothetical protein